MSKYETFSARGWVAVPGGPSARASGDGIPVGAILGAALALSVCVTLALVYWYDARKNGIGFFRNRRILRNGASATAVVVEVLTRSVDGRRVMLHNNEFVLDVTPPSAAPYRAVTKMQMSFLECTATAKGETIPVRIDPRDPSVVRIDLPAIRAAKAAAEQSKKARFDEMARNVGKPGPIS